MPKRPDDISRFCWMGACDDCLESDCRCDHHLIVDWTVAELALAEAWVKGQVELVD